jgi:hypothetical protein
VFGPFKRGGGFTRLVLGFIRADDHGVSDPALGRADFGK